LAVLLKMTYLNVTMPVTEG